jgi:hypothetical protein
VRDAYAYAIRFYLVKKILDRVSATILYKSARQKSICEKVLENQLMMSWTKNRYSAKRHPVTGMRGAAYGPSLSPSIFGGALGQKDTRFEDSRYKTF